tara:strand:+ start:5212 stop:5835 length:624 start_codon:yes stop_codon:yes gene_type:complete
MMKAKLALLLSVLFLALLATPAHSQNNVQSAYEKGVDLYNQQKYTDALVYFSAVLKAKPSYVYARNYSKKCQAALASDQGPKNDIEGQLAKVIVPQINFSEAPIGDVLDYFAARAEELTEGKFVPNFIYKGTPEQRQGTLITLSLKNVPMTEAIRYVGQLSRTQFRYEEHAIVADPNYHSAPDPAQNAAPHGVDPVLGQQSTTNIFD